MRQKDGKRVEPIDTREKIQQAIPVIALVLAIVALIVATLAMLNTADVAVFLPDYQESKGAMVEWAYCKRIGKDCAMYMDVAGGGKR